MNWNSLRLRLIAGGVLAIVAALSIAGTGLTILFERHVTRTISDDLEVHLKQLIAGIDVDPEGRLLIIRPPVDPRFADPLSGLYWQVTSKNGQLLRSRSLWDTTLFLPEDELSVGEVHHHQALGPANAQVLIAERGISLTIKGQPMPVRLAVAVDLARVSAARRAFAKEVAGALCLLGLILVVGTSIQVSLGLSPLRAVRSGVAEIRSGRRLRLPPVAPVEVRPLVDEVNALLDAQEQEMERSRSRTADLAHGLKTPLAALVSDAGRLRERGEEQIAHDIETVSEAMSRHVDREMARARARGHVLHGTGVSVEVAPLVRSLLATLERTPVGVRLRFEPQITEGMLVPFDRTDLAEVLGNLLDNATRHATSRVRIAAKVGQTGVSITIEDDGKGIDPKARSGVLKRGSRMDERVGGAGLGFAIVLDVLEAYGWQLVLDNSNLGGLKATIMSGRTISDVEPQPIVLH